MKLSEADQVDIGNVLGDAVVEALEGDPDGDYDQVLVDDLRLALTRLRWRLG